MDRGDWWSTVHGVTKSRTPLSAQHFHFFQAIPGDLLSLMDSCYPLKLERQTACYFVLLNMTNASLVDICNVQFHITK